MRYRVKGFAIVPVLLLVGVGVLVGAAVGAGAMYYYMSTHQGGLGDGEEMGITMEAATPVNEAAEMQITEVSTEPAPTQPVTEQLQYISITVSGKTYQYKGKDYSLDTLLGIIESNAGLPVRVTDDGASLRAYRALIDALREANVEYVETGSD